MPPTFHLDAYDIRRGSHKIFIRCGAILQLVDIPTYDRNTWEYPPHPVSGDAKTTHWRLSKNYIFTTELYFLSRINSSLSAYIDAYFYLPPEIRKLGKGDWLTCLASRYLEMT